jgi:pimeloyl-ACP methyl ester carboxylesterase
MSFIARTGKTVLFGTLAAAFGVGAIAGVVAERALIGRAVRGTGNNDEQFGQLRSDPVEVIASDGVRIHTEVEHSIGAPDDLTIIFAHGFALNSDEFHYQRRDLRHLARMVFYDHRGHGRSEIGDLSSLRIDQLAADLDAVISTTTPSGPIVLVGHSTGGMAVQALAAQRPDLFGDRIKAVILLCTSSGGVTEVPFGLPSGLSKFLMTVAPTVTDALQGKQDIVDKSREAGNDLTLLLTRRYSFGSGGTPELTRFVASMHAGIKIEVIGNFLKAFSQYDSKIILPVFARVPTVVVAGEADLMTPVESSREIATLIPHSELIVLPDAGHMLQLEKYEEFNDIVTAVVERVRAV